MATQKISAMTAASTPLAGTELIPLIQSGANVQTAIKNLTAATTTASTISTALGYTPVGDAVTNLTVIANFSGKSNNPTSTTLTTMLDSLGSAQGDLLYRDSKAWAALAPGTAGQFAASGGSSANPTWTNDLTPAAAPSTTAVGYLGAPQNLGLDSGNVTLALTDCGKSIYHTDGSARDLTIPANGTIAFPIGTCIAGVNENAAGVVTLKITSDTLRWGSSTGQRTIAANASFSLLKVAATVWRLTGDGIT